MTQINFVKYNKTRREQFQIKTTILEEAGTRYVEKTALTVEGTPHIWSFASHYTLLSQQHRTLQFCPPMMGEDRCSARFPYLTGETLSEVLGREIAGGKAPREAVREAMEKIYDVLPECVKPFEVTPEYEEVFGEAEAMEDGAYSVSNIDALFENVMVTDSCSYCAH